MLPGKMTFAQGFSRNECWKKAYRKLFYRSTSLMPRGYPRGIKSPDACLPHVGALLYESIISLQRPIPSYSMTAGFPERPARRDAVP